jgi:hypothetical protein
MQKTFLYILVLFGMFCLLDFCLAQDSKKLDAATIQLPGTSIILRGRMKADSVKLALTGMEFECAPSMLGYKFCIGEVPSEIGTYLLNGAFKKDKLTGVSLFCAGKDTVGTEGKLIAWFQGKVDSLLQPEHKVEIKKKDTTETWTTPGITWQLMATWDKETKQMNHTRMVEFTEKK